MTEYGYDDVGNRNSQKIYKKSEYKVGQLTTESAIRMTDMQKWLGEDADKIKVALTEWKHNSLGQVIHETSYANIDNNGKGIVDEHALLMSFEWDEHGKCTEKTRKLDEKSSSVESVQYDGLGRIKEECDVTGRIKQHGYKDASHMVAHLATGLTEIVKTDRSGAIVEKIESAEGKVRDTVKIFDRAGRCCIVRQFDGSNIYYIYDQLNRQKFSIDAAKKVTEYKYDANDNVTEVIKYATAINSVNEGLLQIGNWEPQPAGECSVEKRKYDSESRLEFSIDPENYVTELRYDTLGNVTNKILYASKYSDRLPPDSAENDRHYRYFYNKDGSKHAEQTASGHVIAYKRNKLGELLEETRFAIPQEMIEEFDISRIRHSIMSDEKDSYKRDARGQCVEHRDAEWNVATYNHDAAGRAISKKRGDYEEKFGHDALDRITSEADTTGMEIVREFNAHDKLKFEEKRDKQNKSESRQLLQEFDGFAQVTRVIKDKKTISKLLSGESESNSIRNKAFDLLLKEVMVKESVKEDVAGTWVRLHREYNIDNMPLDLDVATTILDEIAAHKQLLSDKAEKVENVNELISLTRVYCAALKEVILQDSWRTYLGGKGHLEHKEGEFLPDLHILPERLKLVRDVLKAIDDIKHTNDHAELHAIKKQLVGVHNLLDSGYAAKSFWRDDKTHNFYGKIINILSPLAIIADEKEKKEDKNRDQDEKIDEQRFYSNDGLCVATCDARGYYTYYYYDELRRPTLMVNPRGAVTEKKYDAYTDVVEELRQYKARLSSVELASLSGGHFTSDIQMLLANIRSDEDEISCDKHDKRGLTFEKTDGEGYQERSKYNAFSELEKREVDLNLEDHTFVIDKFEYDKKGRVTRIIQDALGQAIEEKFKYNDELGEIIHTNGEGNETKTYFDRLHRLVKRIDALGNDAVTEWDELSRIKTEMNELKQTISHFWSQDGRTVEIASPAGLTKIEKDIFGQILEVIKSTGGEKIKVKKKYNDRGQVRSLDTGHGETIFEYDSNGQVEFIVTPAGIQTQYIRNVAGQVEEQIEDVRGLQRSTLYKRDSQGRIEEMCSPEGTWTKYTYNRRGDEIETIVDIDGLNIITTKKYDGLHKLVEKTVGDKVEPDQFKQKFNNDHLGRALSEVVDPAGLDITTANTFNKVGKVKSITDPNGATTWLYYDELSRERFNISPENEVLEKQYDVLGNCVYERSYVNKLTNLNYATLKTKNIAAVLAEIDKTQDRIVHYVFARHSKPQFRLRVLNEPGKATSGILEEFKYDEAGREVCHIRYANMIMLDENKSIEECIEKSRDGVQDATLDRVVNRFYDNTSQERYVIDQSGFVTEKRYDINGKVTSVIQYATAINPGIFNEQSSLSFIERLINPSSEDRAIHRVYDSLQRKIYHVSSNGYVKKYDYDGNDKRTRVCRFKDPIEVNESYSELLKSLNELKPDAAIDSISEIKYDKASRIEKITDALEKEDSYQRNAKGEVTLHTDRNKQAWETRFDRANRPIKEIAPETDISVVTKSEDNLLTHQKIKTSVVNKTDYDKAGNKTVVSFADNISEVSDGVEQPRIVKTDHDSKGRMTGTTVPDATITIGDATVQKDLQTKNIRDYSGRNLLEVAANGGKQFTVYDQMGRKRFTVDAEGYVIEYQYRHAFNEPEKVVHYANGINSIDKTLLSSREEPFTIAEIHEVCKKLTSKLDRSIEFTYNEKGQKITAKKSKGYVVRPSVNENDGRLILVKDFERTITFEYNSFGELIAERHARIDGEPDSGIQRFYDRAGNEIATITAEGYLTVRTFGVKRTELTTTQYFEAIPVDKRSSLDEILKAIVRDETNDRRIVRKYDKRHLCIETTVADGHPFFKTYRDTDRSLKSLAENSEVTTKTEYDANGQPIILTDAYGEKSYLIRNEVGEIIWEIGFPVEVKENEKQIPVRQFLYNAHNQIVGSVIYAMPGNLKFDQDNRIILDGLVSASKLDQKILTLMCNRGLPLVTQDSEKGSKITGFNEGRKPTKSTRYVTVPVLDETGKPQWMLKTREKIWGYNLRDDLVMTHKKDDFDIEATYFEINAFGECTGEGPVPGTYPIKSRFDNAGYKWFTNADRAIATISFPDENDAETLFFRSATRDFNKYLSENGYDLAKEELVDADYEEAFTEFQRWVTYRNLDEQATRQDTPYYSALTESEDYNVTFTVIDNPNGSGHMLRFNCPEEVFLKMKFNLCDKGADNWREIDIQILKDASGRQFCGIPLGDIPSNPYAYRLDFYPTHADGKVSPLPCYSAEGDVMLDTGNYADSTQPIWYMENTTTLVIAGKAADIFGIELLQHNEPVKRIAGTRLADGRLRIDLAGIASNEYSFKYVLGAARLSEDLKLGQAGDYRVNLYKPEFLFNNEHSIFAVNGTFPTEIAPQLCTSTMLATKGLLDGSFYPDDFYDIKGKRTDRHFRIYWAKPIAGAFVSIRDASGVERYLNDFVANAPWRFGSKNEDKHKKEYRKPYTSLTSNKALPLLTVNSKISQNAHALIISNVDNISTYQLADVNNGNQIAINSSGLGGLTGNATFTIASLHSQACSDTVAKILIGSDNENYFQPEEIAITDFSIDTYSAGGYNDNDVECVDGYFAYQWKCSVGRHNTLHVNHKGVNSDIMSIEALPRSNHNNRLYFQAHTRPNQYYAPGNVMLSLNKDGDSIPFAMGAAPYHQGDRGIREIIDDYTKSSDGCWVKICVQRVLTSKYDNMHVLYFKKLPQGTTNVDFDYVYTTSLGKKEWRKIDCHITPKGGLSAFTNNIPAGHYECRIRCKNDDTVLRITDPRAKQASDDYCYMNINITKKEKQFGQVFSNRLRNKKLQVVKPFRKMEQDRWGNQRSVTDREKNTMLSDFNLFNQATALKTPPVMTWAADNTSEEIRLTSSKQVNKRAHVVAEIDEGGDSRKYLVNQKGQHLCTEDADGVQDSHEYDLLSRCTESESAAFGTIRSSFERKDGLLIETREYPNHSTEIITYNEAGHEIKIMSRVANKNNDNDATFMHPDEHNRARITYHPLSHKEGATQRATTKKDFHPRSGVQTKDVNQNGRVQSWSAKEKGATEADIYVGNIVQHVDLAGQTIVYRLNFNKQIISEVGTVDKIANKARGIADNLGNAPLPRNLRYLFDEAGRQTDIIDDGAQLTTRKRHDKEDYCTEYYFIGHNGKVYQATNTTYDELHRIKEILDTHLLIEFGYDKKSHRRYAKASVLGDNREQKEAFRESWYDYSPAGRVRFRDCVMEILDKQRKTGKIKLVAGQGMEVTYRGDGRVNQQKSITEDVKARTATPTYGVGSAVTGIRTHTDDESEDRVEGRESDIGDRLYERTVTSKNKTVTETFELDIDGSILSQKSTISTEEDDKTNVTTIVRSIESKSDLKLVERVITTLYNVMKGVDVIVTDEVTTYYTAADTLLPGSVETKRLSAEKYDPNGRDPDDLLNVEKIANDIKQARIVTRNNANGAVTGIGPDAPTDEGTFPDGYRHFEINSENCYLIKESKEGRNYYFYAQKRPGKTTLMAYFGDIPDNVKNLTIKQLKEVYKPKTLNIDINHQAFSDNFPPTYPGKCIADGVKTYRELAEDLNFTGYADSIAWANNADADSVPSAGTEITIPTMITEVPETAFNGSLPAIEMLLGSMYPALAMPHISIKPPKVNWALIAAEVAVAAAIIYFSGGTLSVPVGKVLGSQIIGAAVAYGVGGMVGNAVSQGIAIAAHQQHGFNVQAMATQGLASAVSGGFLGATSSASSAGTAGTAGAATSAAETGSASAALSVTWGDVAMNIATSEAVAAAQQGALMAAGLQSKPDWKGFAIAAFNGAVDSSVKATFGEGMIATATYTGVTLTGDTLIRGEPVNGAVLSATAVGSMVGNYAGQQAKEAYLQSQPKADAKQARKQKPAANTAWTKAERGGETLQQRPQSAQDKQMQAAESIVDGQQALPDPVLDTGGASYQLSEMNRTRLQRWNSSLGKASQPGSAAAELFRAAQVAGNGETYSFLDDASTMEKATIYGAGAALALAALPEAAAGAAISLTAGALESLGYISMASVGIPMAESMLATEAATAVGGATLAGGASLAGKAYNNASRFFGRGGIGGESAETFASQGLLESHFGKHGSEFKGAYDTASEYLKGAHDVINQGTKVAYQYRGETRIGYVKFMGNTSKNGSAKFEFVGTNNKGNITTYHVESGKDFWKLLNGNTQSKNITPYDYPELIHDNSFGL